MKTKLFLTFIFLGVCSELGNCTDLKCKKGIPDTVTLLCTLTTCPRIINNCCNGKNDAAATAHCLTRYWKTKEETASYFTSSFGNSMGFKKEDIQKGLEKCGKEYDKCQKGTKASSCKALASCAQKLAKPLCKK